MQRDLDDAAEDGKDTTGLFLTFFKLDVLVPERMSQEVQSDTFSSALEKPNDTSALPEGILET